MTSTFETLPPVPAGNNGKPITGYANCDDIPLSYNRVLETRRPLNFWSIYYRIVFRLLGIKTGPGLRVLGPLLLQIDGSRKNIRLGRNITLMPHVHLKVRENGRITLSDQVTLDTGVRLVAANDACIKIGQNCSLGMGSFINAGMDVVIGRGTITSGYCCLNVSDHGLETDKPLREQGFRHSPILIGEDVWLGVHVFIRRGSRIGNGAVVATGAVVRGDIPAYALVGGNPAEVWKIRKPQH